MLEYIIMEKNSHYKNSYDDRMYLKYFFDRIISFLLILILLLPFIVIIVSIIIEGIIKNEYKRACFLLEKRISQGRPFMICKFNIACPGSLNIQNGEGIFLSYRRDLAEGEGYIVGELTPLGNFLKKWYLDELPQLFNILAGHMTFVGPRPLPPPLFYKSLEHGMIAKKILRAGVTGTVQMNKSFADLGNTQVYSSLEYEYLKNIDKLNALEILCYDISIIYKTFSVLLRGEGL